MTGAQMFIAPLVVVLLTRALGTNDYGVYALFISFITFASLLLQVMISTFIIIKLPTKERKDWPKLFFTLLMVQAFLLVAALALLYFTPISNWLLGLNKLTAYAAEFKIALVIILFSALSRVFDCYYKAKKRINLAHFMEFLRNTGWALALFVLVFYRESTLMEVLLIWCAFNMANLGAYFIIARKDLFDFIASKSMAWREIWPSLKFGAPLIPINIVAWVVTAGDKYILNYFTSASIVGIYAVAYSLMGFVATGSNTILNVMVPHFAHAWSKKENHTKILSAALKYGLMLAVPAIVGLFVLREELVTLIAGPDFIEAAAIVPLLALFPLFTYFRDVSIQPIITNDKTVTVLWIYLTGGVLNFGVNMFLVPIYGMKGAAITATCSYLLMALIAYFYARKLLCYEFKFIKPFRIILASIIMGAAIYFVHPASVTAKIATIIGGMAVYGLAVLATGIISRAEWDVLKSLLCKFKLARVLFVKFGIFEQA